MTADTTHSHAPQDATAPVRGTGGVRFGASEKAETLFMLHSAIRFVFAF